jgi:hypothetical protein
VPDRRRVGRISKEIIMSLIRSVRDRVLRRFLPDIEAGACIPSHGCCCGTSKRVGENCFGACVTVTSCIPSSNHVCQ